MGTSTKVAAEPDGAAATAGGTAAFTAVSPSPASSSSSLRTASWNLAAINNNPFEYWITMEDPAYGKMLSDVEALMQGAGGSADVRIVEIFTDQMFDELAACFAARGWGDHADAIAEAWAGFKDRPIVSGFLKDGELGKKRLTSMPDRTTNTLATVAGPAFRPTVINCFEGKMDSVEEWWGHWKRFMFEDAMEMTPGVSKVGADLLAPIKRSKYPALTEAEEAICMPLQTLCLALFDAVQLHVVRTVAPDSWQTTRNQIADALNRRKKPITAGVLANPAYDGTEVWFLQECQAAFIETELRNAGGNGTTAALAQRYDAVAPQTLSKSEQNSALLLSKERFDVSTLKDLTAMATAVMMAAGDGGDAGADDKKKKKLKISDGDLLLVAVSEKSGLSATPPERFAFCSFHGDTDGLASIPVLRAVVAAVKQEEAETGVALTLVCGMDANVYANGAASYKAGKQQGCAEFGAAAVALGLTTATGDEPDQALATSACARTFLQPQLHKGVTRAEVEAGLDQHPKDHILFQKKRFRGTEGMTRDNTGEGRWDDAIKLLPTLAFPSDHCLLRAHLK
jgi:hypothetical protein